MLGKSYDVQAVPPQVPASAMPDVLGVYLCSPDYELGSDGLEIATDKDVLIEEKWEIDVDFSPCIFWAIIGIVFFIFVCKKKYAYRRNISLIGESKVSNEPNFSSKSYFAI